MHRIQRRQTERRAVSLLELVMVMAIIATVATIAAPRYAMSLAAYRADAAARRIVADLGMARVMARTEGRRVRVKFDNTANKDLYFFEDEPDPHDPEEDYTVDLQKDPYRAELVLIDFDTKEEVAFDAYGAAVKHDSGKPFAGPGTIVVASGGIQKTITVDTATGKATVQ
jgi:prepilin-type N-terminal cleavage/methylation domain-containing protein